MNPRLSSLASALAVFVLATGSAACDTRDRSSGTELGGGSDAAHEASQEAGREAANEVGMDLGNDISIDSGKDAGTQVGPDAGSSDANGLKLFLTCGSPVCRGYTGDSGQPLCTTEKVGDGCNVAGQECDPQDACNALVVCADSDPKTRSGAGCPISRRRYKDDIHYLSPAELGRYRDEVMAMRLATWRYKQEPKKERLGFMIDDNPEGTAVDPKRDVVDLYGYTSMTVATIQLQAQQIAALEREVAAMKKMLALPPPRSLGRRN